jgi:dTDP-glucose 4,6-dehydratase
MNILIYGGKGWIGSQFCEALTLWKFKYTVSNTRVNTIEDVINDLNNNPETTHVISFIGRTHGKINGKTYSTIDYLEQPGKIKDNVRDNLFVPLIIAEACKKYSKNNRFVHYTYLGTGCIFTYDNEHEYEKEENGFKEEDNPNFFGSGYSVVKGTTDKLMKLMNNNTCLNLRIRMPITGKDNPRNFITKITHYEKICSIKNSMTVLPEFIPIIADLMKKQVTGTINLTNPGLISHNEILEMYKEYVDPNFTWKNFTIEEQAEILASERSNNYLDTTKLQSLYPDVKNIKDSVRCILQDYVKKDIKIKKNLSNIKNLLVTGGCGFIGSNFINIFYDKYPNVNIINIDALYYCADENNIKQKIRESFRYNLVKGNICSEDLVDHILNYYNIDTVIHFAAQSHVQTSFTDALQYTKDNVMGTHTLLECCRKYGKIKKFIHVSTDEVYGESLLDVEESKKTEHSLLCPTNPYAASKAAAELIVQSYIKSFKMPIIITRGNNVYGPNQYPEKVIPKFIQQLKNGEKITIQGDGSCVRGFLHVNDTVDAFIKILEKGKLGEIYNIGCDEDMEISILDLAKYIYKLSNIKSHFQENVIYIEDRPFNDQRYYIENQKLKNLGWKILKTLEDGLKELIKNK